MQFQGHYVIYESTFLQLIFIFLSNVYLVSSNLIQHCMRQFLFGVLYSALHSFLFEEPFSSDLTVQHCGVPFHSCAISSALFFVLLVWLFMIQYLLEVPSSVLSSFRFGVPYCFTQDTIMFFFVILFSFSLCSICLDPSYCPYQFTFWHPILFLWGKTLFW